MNMIVIFGWKLMIMVCVSMYSKVLCTKMETSKKIFQGNQPFLEMNYGVNLPIIFSSVC
jgi:hypothetical protein